MARHQNPESAIANLIERLMHQVKRAQPTREEMIDDLKMMRFKVRPLAGDIFSLGHRDDGFLETLWRIGKMEELFWDAARNLSPYEKEIFFRHVGSLEYEAKMRLKRALEALPPHARRGAKLLKLEIFREPPVKKDIH